MASNVQQNTSLFVKLCSRGMAVSIFLLCMGSFTLSNQVWALEGNEQGQAKVTGLRHISIHVLELEKTLVLYREILGFTLADAKVLKGAGIEGMLVMKLRANDLEIGLSLTAPEYMHTIGPVGNTNHNHFMLQVNDIETIGNKLKAAGYALENENYATDLYTFFTGPNGEIIGLAGYE